MAVNTAVVGGAVGIAAIGVLRSVLDSKPISGIVIGAYGVALFGSVIDLFPGAGKLAGGIVLLALLGVALDAAGALGKGFAIFGTITGTQSNKRGTEGNRQQPQQRPG